MVAAPERKEYYDLPETTTPPREKIGGRRHAAVWARKDRLVFTGLVLLVFCSCVIMSIYYAMIISAGYRLNKAQHELNLLRTESHDLYTKISELSGLDYVELVAVHKLGMVVPLQEDVVLVQAPVVSAAEPQTAADKDQGQVAAENEPPGGHPVLQTFADLVEKLDRGTTGG